MGDLVRDEDRKDDRTELEPVEDQCHRERTDDERSEHQDGCHEQGDLGCGSDCDVHGEADLVLQGEVDRDPVLGGVTDGGVTAKPGAATATPAPANMITLRRTVHGSPP